MKIASAPVSYGVFGDINVDGVITLDELLQNMAETGFTGCEYGPPRFFGEPGEAARRFSRAGLEPVGAYVPLHTQEPGPVLDRDIERMRMTFEELATAGGSPLVILADEGDPSLLQNPRKDPGKSLTGEDWQRLVDVVNSAADEARELGLEVSFHPHISTYVELPDEIDRLLEDTDVGLTYDVGHVVLAGGDGVELFNRWRDRINHVHIKDVDRSVLEKARAGASEDFDVWWAGVSQRLGTGDANLEEFVDALIDSGFDRWVVIEHDCEPLSSENYDRVIADQNANYAWLVNQVSRKEAE